MLKLEEKRKFYSRLFYFFLVFLTLLRCRCFLVTFYFIHSLLPRLLASNTHNAPDDIEDTIAIFLKEYGSYLRMDTCLAYASVLRVTFVVELLLNIAKHDPRHREAMKQMSKSTSMVFYEPVSAIV